MVLIIFYFITIGNDSQRKRRRCLIPDVKRLIVWLAETLPASSSWTGLTRKIRATLQWPDRYIKLRWNSASCLFGASLWSFVFLFCGVGSIGGHQLSHTLDCFCSTRIAAMMASSYNAKEEDGHHSGAANHGGTGAVKSKKPDNTAFKQQRLPAWQPILTAGTVLPAFFVIGLIFIPIGIGLYVSSNNIKEFEVKSRWLHSCHLAC